MSQIGTDNLGLTPEDYATLADWSENGVQSTAQTGVARNRAPETPELEPEPPGRTRSDRGSITVSTCREWRERNESGESYEEIAEEDGVSTSTLSLHINGECSHRQNPPIDAPRCAVIRCMAADGHSFAAISRLFPSFGARQTISDHGRGACSHDIDIPPKGRW